MPDLAQQLLDQKFPNEYALVDGVAMNAENPENFHIPPPVIKRNVRVEQFVELRIDSPRFSTHDDALEVCTCPSCNGEMSKPILRHAHPATLLPLPNQTVPSRGWGEDFWVQIRSRSEQHFLGTVDNPLAEQRLHGLGLGDEIVFHEDHILAVHDVHRAELVSEMSADDLKELAHWLGQSRD